MKRYRIQLAIKYTYSVHPRRGSSKGLGSVPTSKSRQPLAVDIACTVFYGVSFYMDISEILMHNMQ